MPEAIPVVDLFAGPGGLSEGFSRSGDGSQFGICRSVEKDPYAFETLRLRSFLCQFKRSEIPDE